MFYLKIFLKLDKYACLFVPHHDEPIVSLNDQVDTHMPDLVGHNSSNTPFHHFNVLLSQNKLIVLQVE